MHHLSIAGVGFAISCDFPLPDCFQAFEAHGPAPDPVSIVVLSPPVIDPPGRRRSREKELTFWIKDGCESIALEGEGGLILGSLSCEANWKSAIIRIRPDGDQPAIFRILMEVFFRTALARLGRGLVMHASGVSVSGQGLAFVGPSGMGKSTQARLWEELRQGVVLNDDRPAVTMEGAGPVLHGTPWSGTSTKRAGRSAPLEALVILEQSHHNRARLLTVAETLPRFLPRAFLPYWSEMGTAGGLVAADRLLRKVQVVLLQCRPEAGAVECLEKALERKPQPVSSRLQGFS